MGVIPPTSPFSKVNFHEFGTYTKRASHLALRLSDGTIKINFDDGTSFALLKQITNIIPGSEVITVKGTWTFEPDTEENQGEPNQGEQGDSNGTE